jgi:hypothetical protein
VRCNKSVQHGNGIVEICDLFTVSPKLHSVDQYRNEESSIVVGAATQRLTKAQQTEVRPCINYSDNKYLYRSLIRGFLFKYRLSHIRNSMERKTFKIKQLLILNVKKNFEPEYDENCNPLLLCKM